MTISTLDVGRHADALVQLMRSDEPLDQAHGIMVGVLPPDWLDIAEAFAARGRQDDGLPATARAARIHDWLTRVDTGSPRFDPAARASSTPAMLAAWLGAACRNPGRQSRPVKRSQSKGLVARSARCLSAQAAADAGLPRAGT